LHNNTQPGATFYSLPDNLLDVLNTTHSDNQANYIDPTTYNILSNGTGILTGTLQPNSYIGFANYAFASFPKEQDNKIVYESMPIFAGVAQNSSGVPAVFPISLLYKDDSTVTDGNSLPTHNPQAIDTSL
jgi:hypothetical protein